MAGLLADASGELAPDTTRAQRSAFAALMMIRIAAASPHVITLPPKAARQILAMFKRTLTILPRISDGFVLLVNRLTIVRASLAALKDARTTRSISSALHEPLRRFLTSGWHWPIERRPDRSATRCGTGARSS
ncbi:hypothetical protein LMA02_31190 [Burkholderia sp. B21-005]|nr:MULTISPECIES: hypothetical protein [unclassified Burkholderia]UEP33200.1 hypothetical protein LMA01_35085 [Burkholderia sp. B21-007]UEP46622.1 hypothetical protein LMA02_31190 [Burkholderia sp. B21-005]